METIILWICLALTGAALVWVLRSDAPFFRNPVRRVPATIVRYHRRSEDGAPVFSPVFRFDDESGRPIEIRDKVYTPFETPVPGEVIEIVHPEGHPDKARIPYPVFRTIMYAALCYVFAVLAMKVTGLSF
ncbi:MAG: DUF3592 domain-containing protein [Sphingorhabdus sp.]